MDVSLGIDIGSVSVKTVLLSDDNVVIEKEYIRSNGAPFPTLISILEGLKNYNIKELAITGTGGKVAAELLVGSFVNEVIAVTKGVTAFYPEVRSTIEMGGEDSKLFLFQQTSEEETSLKDFAMNAMCAAGTGSFLDQQAKRLGIKIENDFGELALKSERPPRIAGRCSVFAKSDMIHLQQIGTPVHDILSGLCMAVVRSYQSNICKGKALNLPVMFLGGVAANAGMVVAFEKIFKLAPGSLIVPEHHAHMGAIGALLEAKSIKSENYVKKLDLTKIKKYVKKKRISKSNLVKLASGNGNSTRDVKTCFNKDSAAKDKIKAFLGVDIGSLSTNLAIIDENKQIIARRYLKTAGRPIDAIKQGLKEIEEEVGAHISIHGVGTTGSGRYLIGNLIGVDVVKNEITAQAKAAVHFHKDVDTIFEIGGQDSKYVSLKNGTVVDFEMNKVCAAGTGSFIEEQSERLDIDIKKEFSDLAFKSANPGCYGDRCTVFIESDLISAQQKGSVKEDIIAGLSYSIAYNYLNKVVGTRKIGNKILFQGGVAWNKAVVSAFEKIIGKSIIVPPHHDVTGAIGAALLSLEYVASKKDYKTSFRGFSTQNLEYKTDSFECTACDNLCNISKIEIKGEVPRFYGTRCEKYEVDKKKTKNNIPDLFEERANLLTDDYMFPLAGSESKKIGIPMVLHFHELFPYWKAFFNSLGFEVVSSGNTSMQIIRDSTEHIKAETCFPFKVVHGHVVALLEKKVDYIFLPSIISMEKASYKFKSNCNCPISQALPYMIKSSIDCNGSGVKFLELSVKFHSPQKEIMKQMTGLGKTLGKDKKEITKALVAAESAQQQFKDKISKRGREVIDSLSEYKLAVVLISRPYNGCDPGINLGLPKKLKGMGVLAIPMDFLPLESVDLSGTYPDMYWRSGQKMIHAAEIIKSNDKLKAVFLSNFNCGPDSFIAHILATQLKDKPYLQLELDEHSADAGLITRCEAFFDSIKASDKSKNDDLNANVQDNAKKTVSISLSYKDRTVYFPLMCDHVFGMSAAFNACGIKSQVLPESDRESLDLGRKHATGKECLPFIITLGDFLKKINEPGFSPERSIFFMPKASGPCRFGLYNKLQKTIFEDLGHKNIKMLSPEGKDSYGDYGSASKNLRKLLWISIVATDFLRKISYYHRPYEFIKGETDKAYMDCIGIISEEIRMNNLNLNRLTSRIKEKFVKIAVSRSKRKPVIGVVGEIYLRENLFSNDNVIAKIEKAGGEVSMSSMSEWIWYNTYISKCKSKKSKDFKTYIKSVIIEKYQSRYEKVFEKAFKDILPGHKEPDCRSLLDNSEPYIDDTFEGEAILSIGKAVDHYKNKASGIINIMPFTCMPGMVVTSISQKFRENHKDIPWLNLSFDGHEDTHSVTRISAFVHQSKQYMDSEW